MLNEYQAASAARGLRALRNDPDLAFDVATFRRLVGDEPTKLMTQREAEYQAANEDVAMILSADAEAYWADARQTLAYGRMVLAMGTRRAGRKAERALSRKCEELNASFDNRVPDWEKGMFLVHDINDPETWDERWHACIDGDFPLLRPEYASQTPMTNARRSAQIDVLSDILDGSIANSDAI